MNELEEITFLVEVPLQHFKPEENRVSKLFTDFIKSVSSAYRDVKNEVLLGRSFMFSKKSKGPSTDSWGTPH